MLRRPYSSFVSVAIITIMALFAFLPQAAAQTKKAEDALRVRVSAQTVVVKKGIPPVLHWVIDPLPGAVDVIVSDASVKGKVEQAVVEVQRREAQKQDERCLGWVAETNTTCSFTGALSNV